jgi:hypothetical protein
VQAAALMQNGACRVQLLPLSFSFFWVFLAFINFFWAKKSKGFYSW